MLSSSGPWPPPTFAAERQRRDLIIATPRGEVSKGEGSQPLPFGRFKDGGFSRGKGNRNPFPLEWRFWLLLSLLTKVTRRRQKKKVTRAGARNTPAFRKRKYPAVDKKKIFQKNKLPQKFTKSPNILLRNLPKSDKIPIMRPMSIPIPSPGRVPVQRSIAHERFTAPDLFRGAAAAGQQRPGAAGGARRPAGPGI